jgi:glycerol-3-phosphate dehydrogenase
MAKHAVDEVTKIAGLPPMPCVTASLKIHGSGTAGDKEEQLSTYGSDAENIEELMRQRPSLRNRLASSFAYTEAEVVWAIRSEMARTVEDVLARRLRLLFLDVKAALQAAPRVAELLQAELRKDDQWKSDQLRQFHSLARNYLLDEKGGVPL